MLPPRLLQSPAIYGLISAQLSIDKLTFVKGSSLWYIFFLKFQQVESLLPALLISALDAQADVTGVSSAGLV